MSNPRYTGVNEINGLTMETEKNRHALGVFLRGYIQSAMSIIQQLKRASSNEESAINILNSAVKLAEVYLLKLHNMEYLSIKISFIDIMNNSDDFGNFCIQENIEGEDKSLIVYFER